MHILLIADPMIPVPPKHYGGIERIIDMLCNAYVKGGHRVTLVAHPDSRTAGELVPLPGRSCVSKIDVIRNAVAIGMLVSRLKPDLVHSFGRLVQLLPCLPLNVPKVMSYQREPYLPGIARAYKIAKRGTLSFTGCSNYITKQISACATAATVYNGVPTERFTFRTTVSEDAPLCFLGRIEQIKGVHNAIDIAESSGRRLVIAGNIPTEDTHQNYFTQYIQPRLSERIRYIGPVDDQQKNELLGGALALVMAIEWDEPFGIVMAESLACGTPVIGTCRGAIPEVIVDGKHGFVRQSIHELNDCVNKISLIKRIQCRQHCLDKFSDAAVANSYLHQYTLLAK